MGLRIPDSSLLDLVEKVRSWISLGSGDLTSLSSESKMSDNVCQMCSHCEMKILGSCLWYHCKRCGRVFCDNCGQGCGSFVIDSKRAAADAGIDIQSCKFCVGISRHKIGGKYSEKIHPSDSPRQSPEPPSPNCCGDRFNGHSLKAVSVCHSPIRSDEDDGEDSAKHFFSPYSVDTSDIDSSSVSTRHEFYSFMSVGSSPSDSPSRIHITSNRVGHSVQQQEEQEETPRSQNDGHYDHQQTVAVLKSPDPGTNEDSDGTYNDVSIFREQCDKLHMPLDFENNGLIWFPPAPDDENAESENNFFAYDDEDDEMGESSAMFSSSESLASLFPEKDKQNEDHKEPLRAVVQGHFRALVSQLLHGEQIASEDWLDIITSIAWQAANFVKPDTSRGGSMDPCDYVKVKCVASGSPSESLFVKGVVCTKNIKHKRMTSQYKNPRLLVLGGALEYQRAHNQLASFDTLLQQEIDHLKMIVSKIEAHRPNVLLVEKSVSSYAQEYLLAKEISLVLNVKRPLLERISRCTGAPITPFVDKISTTRLGQCELFRLEKFSEEHEAANQFNRKPSKTLMFFEGCPRRLGCTVLLKGSCREELKKVKHVVQFAVFAAYHLSLETSFLADEGASLPKITVKPSVAIPEQPTAGHSISVIPSFVPATSQEVTDSPSFDEEAAGLDLELPEQDLLVDHHNPCPPNSSRMSAEVKGNGNNFSDTLADDLAANVAVENVSPTMDESIVSIDQGERQSIRKRLDEIEVSNEYFSATDSHQSILVSFSSRCVLNGTVCERSRLLRIKFYGCFDKPLGRYLQDDLFDQASCCRSCKEPAEAHVICYTHQQGNLTINVRRLPSVKLPGDRDGKIWMWHRCLRCAPVDGVPPAARRVVMSDAAWGLSFGKFLELSFSNHATANRVASCGHSLQRDCLRFYGFGSMVAFFRYSPIDILSVHLPPSVLQFDGHFQQDWLTKEVAELLSKAEAFYDETSSVLYALEQKGRSLVHDLSGTSNLMEHIMELKDLLIKERDDYTDLFQPSIGEASDLGQVAIDVFELNHLRRALLISSHVWDGRLSSLDSLLRTNYSPKGIEDAASNVGTMYLRSDSLSKDNNIEHNHADFMPEISKSQEFLDKDIQSEQNREADGFPSGFGVPEDSLSNSCSLDKADEVHANVEIRTSLERAPSAASVLSDKIDSAWTGTLALPSKAQLQIPHADGAKPASVGQINQVDNPQFKKLLSPARVYSFDSALRIQDRIKRGLPPSSLHLTTLRSFHASGDFRNMVRDPVANVHRTYSQLLPREAQKYDLSLGTKPSYISSVSLLPEGVRLLLPHSGQSNVVIAVYDNEPTSIICYALASKEHEGWVAGKPSVPEGRLNASDINRESSVASNISTWQSFSSLDLDYYHYGSYGSEDVSTAIGSLFTDSKGASPHLKIQFEDESSHAGGKVKFSVTCYFAKQFDALRKKCCPSEGDFIQSLSRCKRWSAQGGKSNVYFAKSLDERFIIKQVTKTELESFEEFAPEYFKYLTDSLNSGSPTCLAKIVGIFQVTVKHLRGGKETKMDMMVMENLFFKRSISRVYDLKGSARSRYNSDTSGTNKTLLDMNLLETLRTKPIFLGSKAKRSLERAVWNDTSFLASIDVMDYSLLVGVDDEKKELVLGIIDFVRQYTWDKHLETWVKASGILGGPKNASPTIVSPKQYKRRFRKAMTTYFLTVPDQWSS